MKRLLILLLCRLFKRHTPFEKASAPKEIGLGEWFVELSGTCRRCGVWRRRRKRVAPPPCDHVFPHVCEQPACKAQAEKIWGKAGSVQSVLGEVPGGPEEEMDEDELIDRESGVKR